MYIEYIINISFLTSIFMVCYLAQPAGAVQSINKQWLIYLHFGWCL